LAKPGLSEGDDVMNSEALAAINNRDGGNITAAAQGWDCYSAACPSRLVLNRLADKWALLIMGSLAAGPVRFNELRRRIDGVSQKMLSQTLKNLERDGLICRRAYATVPVTVEYAMTDLGATLADTIIALRLWTATHMNDILASQSAYDSALGKG
jgi:DNA-binding HxlR family transcriptional regulator